MGYEIRLRVVQVYRPSDEVKKGKPYIEGEGDSAYLEREWLKDDKGEYQKTGRTEISMGQVAMVDLCKMGDGPFSRMVSKHQLTRAPRNAVYKWFGDDGNTLHEKDSYNTYCKPAKLDVVVKALEAESKGDPYRRTNWALDLLKSIQSSSTANEFMVVFEGH